MTAENHATRRPVAADPAAPDIEDLLDLGVDPDTAVWLVRTGRRLDAHWRNRAAVNEGDGR